MAVIEESPERGMAESKKTCILVANIFRSCVCRQVQDITAVLKERSLPGEDPVASQEQRYLQTLHAQVNCMISHSSCITFNILTLFRIEGVAWSQQADFGLTPNPLVDGSILALGNRAGSVVLMRLVDSLLHLSYNYSTCG